MTNKMAGMKYSDIVDYDKLDPFKEECIRRLRSSFKHLDRFGMGIIEESVGETAVAIDIGHPKFYLAFNVEGLGTKNMVAEAMAESERAGKGIGLEVRQLFSGLGIDNMAMSLNDLTGIGAIPLLYGDIIATGSSDYLADNVRASGLIDGFVRGAEIARVVVPVGETPTLKGIVAPNTIDMAGASIGIIPRERLTIGTGLEAGLIIFGIQSSGIHANGLSLARKIASEKCKEGYFTRLPSGRTFGEALLTPTVIYAPFVEKLSGLGTDVRYMPNITGHGWAKIMRKKRDLTYIIESIPEPQEEFRFMQEQGPVDDEQAYKTWNMGIGWVVFAPASEKRRIEIAGATNNLKVYELGHVEKGERAVVIAPKNIIYKPR